MVPFEVSNAPTQFMNLMNDVLANYLDDFVMVFLDDILIYFKTLEDHVVHLRKALQKLKDHQLYCPTSSNVSKIRVVQEWDTP